MGSNGKNGNTSFATFSPKVLPDKGLTPQASSLRQNFEREMNDSFNSFPQPNAELPKYSTFSEYIKSSRVEGFKPLPIVLPQKFTEKDRPGFLPFPRAYPTCLQKYFIDKPRFINFVDELNERYTKHQIFHAMDMAGQISRYTQEPIAMGVGAGLQVAALVGGKGVSYKRTKDFLKRTNEEMFAPKGLQVSVVNTEKMMILCGNPSQAIHISASVGNSLDHQDTNSNDHTKKILMALRGFVADLDWNVEGCGNLPSDNIMAKFGQFTAQSEGNKRSRGKQSQIDQQSWESGENQKSLGQRDGRQRHKNRNGERGGRDRSHSMRDKKSKSLFGGKMSDMDIFEKTKWIVIIPNSSSTAMGGSMSSISEFDLEE